MLELKLKKENPFLKVLEAILDLVDEASVDCSSKGLKLQAIDTELVAIISLHFPHEIFDAYICDEKLSMGIPIDDMVKVIRCADKDDTITIKFGDGNLDTITLSFQSPVGNDTMAYDLRLVDANDQHFPIPDWQVLESKYQAFVEMPSADFMHACKCLSNIDYDGDIFVTEDGLLFCASGKSGRVSIKYKKEAITEFSMEEEVSMTLDTKYMKSFAKMSTLFDQVRIFFSRTQPLMVESKIGHGGYLRYFLAPKTKTEEESRTCVQLAVCVVRICS
ncbi:unnamed protein product [Urochloa decumbens]|uniref:DNA sliding clamp PCNA n=1 Tax=Urochloa decumbens TaxID=240449 RepID=A0ABC8ZKW2_9POAL